MSDIISTKVVAVGSASNSRDPYLAGRIEAAMSQAVRDALAEGIPLSEAETISHRMQAARAHVLAESRRQG